MHDLTNLKIACIYHFKAQYSDFHCLLIYIHLKFVVSSNPFPLLYNSNDLSNDIRPMSPVWATF